MEILLTPEIAAANANALLSKIAEGKQRVAREDIERVRDDLATAMSETLGDAAFADNTYDDIFTKLTDQIETTRGPKDAFARASLVHSISSAAEPVSNGVTKKKRKTKA